MKESYFKKKLMTDLKAAGFFTKKMNPQGNAGFPDILALNDIFFGIELKQCSSLDNLFTRWTEIQRHNAKQILRAGGLYVLAGTTSKSEVYAVFHFPIKPELQLQDALTKTMIKEPYKLLIDNIIALAAYNKHTKHIV